MPDGGESGQHLLSALLLPAKPNAHMLRNSSPEKMLLAAQAALANLEAKVRSERPDVLIISTETFFRDFDAGQQPLLEAIQKLSDTIEVVAWLREPVSQFTSIFQQRARTDLELTPIAAPEYRPQLESWLKAVGRESITLREYDRQLLKNGDIFDDFNEVCFANSLDLKDRSLPPANIGFSAEALSVFRVCLNINMVKPTGRFSPFFRRLRTALWEFDAADPAPCKLWPRAGIIQEIEDTTTDLRWMHETFDFQFQRPFLRDGSMPRGAARVPASVDEIFEIDQDRFYRAIASLKSSHPAAYRICAPTLSGRLHRYWRGWAADLARGSFRQREHLRQAR